MNYGDMVLKLEVEAKKLAQIRDNLRDLNYEIEAQLENVEFACEQLGMAIDALSELN